MVVNSAVERGRQVLGRASCRAGQATAVNWGRNSVASVVVNFAVERSRQNFYKQPQSIGVAIL